MPTNKNHEFPGLSPAAFQHPLDLQAVENLKKVPLLTPLLTTLSSSIFERQMRLMSVSSTVRLSPNQGQSIYEKFQQAAAILDISELPEIYVSNQYVINAYAFGIKKYQITLFSGLIDALTEDELLAVIGHELGHIKCQHMLYKSVAYILRFFGTEFLRNLLPAGTGLLAAIPLQLAILHWERMAELSCDRAALLVVQDRQIVASALSKMAGGSQKLLPEINLEGVLQQAEEYEETDGNMLEQIFKVNMLLLQTHPFPIVRAKEIMAWGESEQYKNILAGNYVRWGTSPSLAISEPVTKVCPNCASHVRASAPNCYACGSGLRGARLICTSCGIKVFSTWHTCPGCGAHLQPAEQAAVA
ncbi:MAG TPA: M48 family metallopeptidase [Anaerolineae bacterium]|nr:M48 family metallopeptidase [Anaerolineae bacterium]